MGTRREGREAAVQYLFSDEINSGDNPAEDLESFFSIRQAKPNVREFATVLIDGIRGKLDDIDVILKEHTQNYEIDRLSAIDRNILRLAIYEIIYLDDIPPAVSINEAIEIAKRFGTEDSGRFVNGILDSVRKAPR